MKMYKANIAMRARSNLFVLSVLLPVLTIGALAASTAGAQNAGVSEADLRDVIHGKRNPSADETNELDLNSDGKIDVADIVSLLKSRLGLETLVGDHVGVFYRDGGEALLEGLGETIGQLPLNIIITNDEPLAGVIDNRDENPESPDSTPNGQFSLYFPKERLDIQFSSEDGYDLVFSVAFETDSPNLSPDLPLSRTITFKGRLDEDNPRFLGGTYEEVISGISNTDGTDLSIGITGKFILNLGRDIENGAAK